MLYQNTGRHFHHNIHSVRVLDEIFPYNISLQTLNGIACHNGELELSEYRPKEMSSFDDFDLQIESCYQSSDNVKKLIPSTLEGCVVRIADIIAYLGKDRQDANRAKVSGGNFLNTEIGSVNAEMINNLIVNIIENSYGKPYIKMDTVYFEALVKAKKENYEKIYRLDSVESVLNQQIRPMMHAVYDRMLMDLKNENTESPIYKHHIDYIKKSHYLRATPYENTEPNQIVTDYIASMTDDYFVDLYTHLFPENKISLTYKGYFD